MHVVEQLLSLENSFIFKHMLAKNLTIVQAGLYNNISL